MKVPIISLVLSLVFVVSLIFQSIVYKMPFESSTSSKVEYKSEKRMIEVSLDDTSILASPFITLTTKEKSSINEYKHKVYAFKLNHSLFKPPIFL